MYEAKLTLMGRSRWPSRPGADLLREAHQADHGEVGLYELEMIDIKRYMKHSTHFFPIQLTGEPGLSSGAALSRYVEKFCGVISVGPFGCMNSRMTEAVAEREMTVAG
jgi:predicted nucleotide-binding protein (sugar kinase/HSP70/actin superfamily)